MEEDYKCQKTLERHEKILKQFESDLKTLNGEINIPKIDAKRWK